jgi:hypothetical protein
MITGLNGRDASDATRLQAVTANKRPPPRMVMAKTRIDPVMTTSVAGCNFSSRVGVSDWIAMKTIATPIITNAVAMMAGKPAGPIFLKVPKGRSRLPIRNRLPTRMKSRPESSSVFKRKAIFPRFKISYSDTDRSEAKTGGLETNALLRRTVALKVIWLASQSSAMSASSTILA